MTSDKRSKIAMLLHQTWKRRNETDSSISVSLSFPPYVGLHSMFGQHPSKELKSSESTPCSRVYLTPPVQILVLVLERQAAVDRPVVLAFLLVLLLLRVLFALLGRALSSFRQRHRACCWWVGFRVCSRGCCSGGGVRCFDCRFYPQRWQNRTIA